MSEKQDQKDGSARAPSNRNDAHDHVGTLRTIMLEKVRIIVGIRSPNRSRSPHASSRAADGSDLDIEIRSEIRSIIRFMRHA
jgi:hypothetical protein